MRVLFCGTGSIGVPSLFALRDSGRHVVAGVCTQPDRRAGRGREVRMSPVKEEALKCGWPVMQPEKIGSAESVQALAATEADLMVVAAYGQILPVRVLQLPRHGCVNIHASLLPKHRGASPIQAAILAGEVETGVTIIAMDEGLDTGDILALSATPILEGETAGHLHDRLAALAPEVLLAAIDAIEAGACIRTPQDDSKASYAPKLNKADGVIDWSRPAVEIERRVRAMSPWPGAVMLTTSNEWIKVHRAELANGDGLPGQILCADATGIIVASGVGALRLLELQSPGRKRLSAKDFLNGASLAVGDQLVVKPSS